MSRSVKQDYEAVRAQQAREQEPAMSEWEIVGRRAMQECERQITADEYSARRILHILKYGSTS